MPSATTSLTNAAIPVRTLADLPQPGPVHIFGAGESGHLLREMIEQGGATTVAGFVDSHKSGSFGGLEILDLPTFVDRGGGAVVIASEAYAEIGRTLFAAGVRTVYDAFPLIAGERSERLRAELRACRDALGQIRAEWDQRGRDLFVARYFLDLQRWQNTALSHAQYGPPVLGPEPRPDIPPDLLDRYGMNSRAIIEYRYLNERYPSNYPRIYTPEEVAERFKRIACRQSFAYPGTDEHLMEALVHHPVKDLSVAVIGSISPWFESVCLYYGGHPTTIEYNPIISRIPGHRALTPAEWERDRTAFDAAFSISSFEHDGLGGYGDPLDPEGDLKAMARTRQMLKPGGLLFLAVPIGRDRVVFNMHRIYGRARLPLLLDGWTLIDTFGFYDAMLDEVGGAQPVLVLRNG